MSKRKIGNITIPQDPPSSPSFVAIIILFAIPELITKAIGGYLLYKRIRNEATRRRYQTFRRYANAIVSRGINTCSIRELAASLGVSNAQAASDLQEMIDQGMFQGNAYIDRSHMTLYMDGASPETVETNFVDQIINVFVSPEDRARAVADAKAAQAKRTEAQAAPQSEAKPRQEAPKPQSTGMENEDFENKLREIRQLNDEIADKAVSDRIDRIGELTASIFRVVREKPEHAEEVRKFMNYYLPTTLKLLKSYSLMEKQSYQGETIVASRKKIEDVLDTLVHAFEQQQDRLFRTEALDVETDISVLETMMASDGLLEQQQGGLRMGGH